ncbi:MAG: hypothetical protein RLN60_01725 [Phycisphaerales bacterium]
MKSAYPVACLALCAGLAVATLFQTSNAQPANQGQQQGQPDIGAMLAKGLSEIEGCEKVLFAQTTAGNNTIMAWFTDKAAAKRWYYSETHTSMMGMVGSDPHEGEPMANVPEGVPVFVMATITPTSPDKSVIPGPMPVSQISIELYTPLDAGAAINGGLMPDSMLPKSFKALDLKEAQAN